jgi:hypothetical protein
MSYVLYTHTPIHTYTHTPIHTYTHTHIHTYTHTPLHPYTHSASHRSQVLVSELSSKVKVKKQPATESEGGLLGEEDEMALMADDKEGEEEVGVMYHNNRHNYTPYTAYTHIYSYDAYIFDTYNNRRWTFPPWWRRKRHLPRGRLRPLRTLRWKVRERPRPRENRQIGKKNRQKK